jgi:hypothetical protein
MSENDSTGGERRRTTRRRDRRPGRGNPSRGAAANEAKTGAGSGANGRAPKPAADGARRAEGEPARDEARGREETRGRNEARPRGEGRGRAEAKKGDDAARRGDARRDGREKAPRPAERAVSIADREPRGGGYYDRPRWSAPAPAPLPTAKSECPRCGKPIEDIASARGDRESGGPVHFDCALNRIAEGEDLGEGDKVVYIGGGRFGVVHFDNPQDTRRFQIKKTIQWEEKDKRSEWRRTLADHFSTT